MVDFTMDWTAEQGAGTGRLRIDRLLHRLAVIRRARRQRALRRRYELAVIAENPDPRLLVDLRVDRRRLKRHDWLAHLALQQP